MAHSLAEFSVFTPVVEVPDDGDDLSAASVETPVQQLTNRTKHLDDRFAGAQPITGHPAITGSLTVSSTVAAYAMHADTTISCGDFSSQSGVYAQDSLSTDNELYVGGPSTLQGPVDVNGPVSIAEDTTIAKVLTVSDRLLVGNGGMSVGAAGLSTTGNLRPVGGLIHRILQAADADGTINAHQYDVVHSFNASLTGNRAYVIANAGTDGQMCTVYNHQTSGGQMTILAVDSGTLDPGEWLVLARKSSQWRIIFKYG